MAAVLTLVIAVVRRFAVRAPSDAEVLRRVLRQALKKGRWVEVRDTVYALRPAWAAEVLWPLFDPALPGHEAPTKIEETLSRIQDEAVSSLRWLRVLAFAASAVGFIGASIQIHWVFNGEHGLMRLQAGLVENVGLSRAVLSIAIGMATSGLALGTYGALRSLAAETLRQAKRTATSLEDTVEALHPQDA